MLQLVIVRNKRWERVKSGERERDKGENTEKCLFSEMHGFMPFSMMHILFYSLCAITGMQG